MPKYAINYQNIVMYKILFSDKKEIIVGFTTNFNKRKQLLKKTLGNTFKIVLISKFSCKTKEDALIEAGRLELELNKT